MSALLLSSLPQFEQAVFAELSKEDSSNVDSVKVARKSMELRMGLYNKVFGDLTTDRAKLLIGDDPAQESFDKKFSSGLIYGEVVFASLVHIIQNAHPKKGEVFVDLGHGTGKALVAIAAVFGDKLSHIHGIELLEPLHNESLNRIALCCAAITNNELFSQHGECAVTARLGSFLEDSDGPYEFDWTKADIVFVNSTCFDATLMKNIASKAERMQSGGRLITLTYSLPSKEFDVTYSENYAMSWGIATCFVHVRR